MSFQELLAKSFAPYGNLSPGQLQALEEHWRLLNAWNQKLNLTRIRDEEQAVLLHYCESLFLGTLLPTGPLRVADIGSGPGFPGLPIAILRPDLQIELVESHQRKAVFLKEASRALKNVSVCAKRGEDLLKGQYDWVVSRAVRPQDVIEMALASNIALLTSRAELAGLSVPQRIVPVPSGDDRVVVLFHVEH